MFYTKDPSEFFSKNYDELIKIVLWILNRPSEHDTTHELLHSYYVSVVRNHTLDKYDPSRTASFETYMCMSIRSFVYSASKPTVKASKTTHLSEANLLPTHDPDPALMIDLQRFRETLEHREQVILDLLSKDNRPFEACKVLKVSNMTISYYRKRLIDKWKIFSKNTL